ncbi:MAG: hypothetical protein NXI31_09610 [bacterium]|nr:hypothetical protein [bacterium]
MPIRLSTLLLALALTPTLAAQAGKTIPSASQKAAQEKIARAKAAAAKAAKARADRAKATQGKGTNQSGKATPPARPRYKAPPTVSEWFPETIKTLAAEEAGDQVMAEFPFTNPRQEELHWHYLAASCACSHIEIVVGDRRFWWRAKPRELVELVATGEGEVERRPARKVAVAPGQSGVVEIHADLKGKPGKKLLRADLHSSDEYEPQIRLQLEVQQKSLLLVEPKSIQLGLVEPNEARKFSFLVRSLGDSRNFQIHAPTDLPAGMKVELERVAQGNRVAWKVLGTYGPIKSGRGSGGTLKFGTNLPKESSFTVRVDARVAQIVEARPGFLGLGRVDPKKGKTARVVFHANDGADLTAANVRLTGAIGGGKKVETRIEKSGKDVILEVVIPPGISRGLLKGELEIELSHPQVKVKRVPFNGFAR